MFGRKGLGRSPAEPPQPPQQGAERGHQAVLEHLARAEVSEPGIRERLAGGVLFDLALQLLNDERGVRVENLLAMLASVGGRQCLAPILQAAPPKATLEQMGLLGVQGNDGQLYLFGDPPNRLLAESEDSLISLAFGAAQGLGAAVTLEMIHAEMKLVASRVGAAEFEMLDLPEAHWVDKPSNWARHFTPRIVEALDTYRVPPMRRATAIGYAIQKVIDAGKSTLDPLTAARIVLQCATRTSKFLAT